MGNQELLTFSIAILILISLLIFQFITPIQARKTPAAGAQCSSSCGDIENISYPFRLKGGPAECGDLDYELYCDNNKTILNFHAGLYYVKTISYDRHIIRLVDVNLATGNCGLPNRSLGIAEVLGDSRYNTNFDHPHVTFVRCSNEINNNPPNSTVPCLSSPTSPVYVNFSQYMLYPIDIPSSCNIISMVLTVEPDNKANALPSNYEAIRRTLQLGFDLEWSVECRDCKATGGYCHFPNEQSNKFRCTMDGDYIVYQAWQTILKFLASISGLIIFHRFILLPLIVLVFILHKRWSTRKKVEKVESLAHIQQS